MSDDEKSQSPATVEGLLSASGWLTNAQGAAAEENKMGLLEALRLCPKAVFWSVAMSTAIIMEGYDTMLMGNLYAQTNFKQKFGVPASGGTYEISAAWQAGLGNGSACGQLIGLMIGGYISEQFGFRRTTIIGLVIIAAMIFIQFFAPTLAVLELGLILFGVPLGMFQTTPIIYAMEITPAVLRPYLTTYVNLCWAIGHLIGAGILRGTLNIEGDLAWRITFAIQWIWPVILIPVLFLAPESPWWLVRRGRLEEAKAVLHRLTAGGSQSFNIENQVALMVVTTEHERAVNAHTSYWACFKGTDLRRTLIGVGVYCTQVLSGNNLRSSSTYFLQQAGLPTTQSFNMTIVSYAVALVGGLCTWILLPLWGRRSIHFWSLFIMFVLMIFIGGLGVPLARSGDVNYAWAIGALLIISSFLYNCSMGTLTNTICAEIPSALLRSKSVVLARWSYSVVSIAAGSVSPYMLNKTAWNWGAKAGFFWAGGCFISCVFAWFCVPETKARTTAEIDILFERRVSLRKFASTPVELVEAINEEDLANRI